MSWTKGPQSYEWPGCWVENQTNWLIQHETQRDSFASSPKWANKLGRTWGWALGWPVKNLSCHIKIKSLYNFAYCRGTCLFLLTCLFAVTRCLTLLVPLTCGKLFAWLCQQHRCVWEEEKMMRELVILKPCWVQLADSQKCTILPQGSLLFRQFKIATRIHLMLPQSRKKTFPRAASRLLFFTLPKMFSFIIHLDAEFLNRILLPPVL